ncbi:MAG: glycine zipper domain-containing protein [Limisphaerales bacterium]
MKNDATEMMEDQAKDAKEIAADLKNKAKAAGTAAWDATRATYQQVQEKTVACSKATDQAIRENPYVALGVGFGVGLLLGLLVTDSCEESEEENE